MTAASLQPPAVGRAQRPVIVICGATACGKSALALNLARETPAVIINADAMQVYAELRILTARPGPDACAAVPHRLYGVLTAAERCSAGRWLALACTEIEAAWAADRLPIVVGGTGLYLKALLTGLSAIPPIPEAVRTEVSALAADHGLEGLRRDLARLDPHDAARAATLDRQRLMRALEVVLATGHGLRWWQERAPPCPPLGARFRTILLSPDASTLSALIDARFERMMEEGALDEVRALLALGLDPQLPAMKAVGVRELKSHLLDDVALAIAIQRAKQASRALAKRQRTWLRHQLIADLVVAQQYSPSIRDTVATYIHSRLLTPPA